MRQKGLGTGRKFTSKFSNRNTFPIQISLTVIETLGGTTSAGIWFQSLSAEEGWHFFIQKTMHFVLHLCVQKKNTLCYVFIHNNLDTLRYIFICKKRCTLRFVFISKIYCIVLIPNYKRTYDQSDQIEK